MIHMNVSLGSSRSNATGFLKTWPVCKTRTRSALYSPLFSSYPFLFCHLSTSPHCGYPSQVRTIWVTQGGSLLEHGRLYIRYLIFCFYLGSRTAPECVSDSASLMACHTGAFLTHAGLNTQDFIKSITARWCLLYNIHIPPAPLPLCNSKQAC